MPLTSLSDPVTRPAGLEELADILEAQSILGVDTESNSLFAYREQVCLVQFSTLEADYLVDPLALVDLTPLAEVFASPRIEKVFHAAEYDLICLLRDFGFHFSNLFDTMLAARILGRKEVGLGALLEAEFGLQVDKRYQRANWGARPLPEPLLSYARQDTHSLIPLRERLRAELEEKGLLPLALEDFQRLSQLAPASNHDGDSCWKITGAHDLTPQQAAVLQELCEYRDSVARVMDRPLFKVIGNQTLHAIASALPASLEELKALPGMSDFQLRRHGRSLLQAVRRGLQAQPILPPRPPRPDNGYLNRLELLRKWRKAKGVEMSVESDIILPRDLLFILAERNPRTPEALAEAMSDTPWRLEHFGPHILKLLSRQK